MNPLELTATDEINLKAMHIRTAKEDSIIKQRMAEAWLKKQNN